MSSPLNFPNSPSPGAIYAGGPGGGTWQWDGTKWESSTSPSLYLPIAGGTMTGLLTLSGDPTAALGAVTKQYSDTKLALAGGTMTGLLVLSGNATAALNPVSLQQLQDGYLPLAGGTVTGTLILSASGGYTLQIPNSSIQMMGFQVTGSATVASAFTVGGVLSVQGNIVCTTINTQSNTITCGTVNSNGNVHTTNQFQGPGYVLAGDGTNLNIDNGSSGNLGTLTLRANTIATSSNITCGGGIIYPSGNHHIGLRYPDGQGVISFDVDGTWSGNAPISTSDPRLKSNIAPIDVNPLNVINEVSLHQFDMLHPGPEPSFTSHFSVGFMSNELSALIPEAVTQATVEGEYDTLNWMPLVAYAFAAIQQLTATVATLKERLAALEHPQGRHWWH